MAEKLRPSISQLPAELQRQLNFEFDPQQEWLFNDKFSRVGNMEYGESFSARVRVSRDGTRFEVGARIQDLEGLLELNRIVRPTVQNVDTVIDFWQNNPRIGTRVEDEWVYIGTNIEPTTEGMEKEFLPVKMAYEVALQSAISGRSYDDLVKDEWWGNQIRSIESTKRLSSSGLFGITAEEQEKRQNEPESSATHEVNPPVTAKNLREFPLNTHKTSLYGIPGTMVMWDGRIRELDGAWIIAYNGRPEVNISDSKLNYDGINKKWIYDSTGVTLHIPKGVEIRTVDDLVKLHKAKVELPKGKGAAVETTDLNVDVVVEDNSFRIVAQDLDNPFSLEMRASVCTDCQLPYWDFRWPDEGEEKEDWDFDKEFGMYSTSVGGARGNYECHVDTQEGKKLYCFDCVKKLEAAYLEKHPTAKRSTAIEIAQRKLVEAGYPDVQISDAWREDGGWELSTSLVYERDGKTIRRYTGVSILTDDGEFTQNMQPREYVDFRYKAT